MTDTNLNTASPKNDTVQFYSVFEVMKITGLSRISIHRRIKDKTLRSIKLGRRVLIHASFIEDLMAKEQAVLSTKGGDK